MTSDIAGRSASISRLLEMEELAKAKVRNNKRLGMQEGKRDEHF
jgi:hypothetical protein